MISKLLICSYYDLFRIINSEFSFFAIGENKNGTHIVFLLKEWSAVS